MQQNNQQKLLVNNGLKQSFQLNNGQNGQNKANPYAPQFNQQMQNPNQQNGQNAQNGQQEEAKLYTEQIQTPVRASTYLNAPVQASVVLSPAGVPINPINASQQLLMYPQLNQAQIPVGQQYLIPHDPEKGTYQLVQQSVQFQQQEQVDNNINIVEQSTQIVEKPVYYEKETQKIIEKKVKEERVKEVPIYVKGDKEEMDLHYYKNKITAQQKDIEYMTQKLKESRTENITLNQRCEEYEKQIAQLKNQPVQVKVVENIIEKPVEVTKIVTVDKKIVTRTDHYDKEEMAQLQRRFDLLLKDYENVTGHAPDIKLPDVPIQKYTNGALPPTQESHKPSMQQSSSTQQVLPPSSPSQTYQQQQPQLVQTTTTTFGQNSGIKSSETKKHAHGHVKNSYRPDY